MIADINSGTIFYLILMSVLYISASLYNIEHVSIQIIVILNYVVDYFKSFLIHNFIVVNLDAIKYQYVLPIGLRICTSHMALCILFYFEFCQSLSNF